MKYIGRFLIWLGILLGLPFFMVGALLGGVSYNTLKMLRKDLDAYAAKLKRRKQRRKRK